MSRTKVDSQWLIASSLISLVSLTSLISLNSLITKLYQPHAPNFLSEAVRCGASQKRPLKDSTNSTALRGLLLGMCRRLRLWVINLLIEGCRYNARQKCHRWVVLDVWHIRRGFWFAIVSCQKPWDAVHRKRDLSRIVQIVQPLEVYF